MGGIKSIPPVSKPLCTKDFLKKTGGMRSIDFLPVGKWNKKGARITSGSFLYLIIYNRYYN